VTSKLLLTALAAVGLVAVGLVVIGVAASHRSSDRPPARRAGPDVASPSAPAATSPSRTSPAASAASAAARVTAAQVAALLPLGEGDIAAGVELARRFIAAYATWRYDEPAQQYTARLAPLMSAQLRPAVQTAADDPTLTSQRRRLQETSTGAAEAEVIRTLGPTSITVLVAGTEHIHTPSAAYQSTSLYAVTVTRTDDRGWRVDAIELATTGDTGDTPQPDAATRSRHGGDTP
jgi:hypothetical protein